ncbi:hypothetical protein ACIQNG_25770 [Streptomyces sp. NPDC091377]
MNNEATRAVRRMATLCNCVQCGGASVITLPNGRQKCLDCGREG